VFENAIKVVLKFSKRFWPKELHGVICSDSIIPEFWFDSPDRVGALSDYSAPSLSKKYPEDFEPTYLACGFACSELAAYILSLPKKEAISQVLKQLDDMFGSTQPNEILRDLRVEPDPHRSKDVNGPRPATDAFLDSHIQDWSKEPYVLGGYSSPSIGETHETRDALAEPVNDKVYFCGEHTNRSYMTLNSAMKSGEMCAEKIINKKK